MPLAVCLVLLPVLQYNAHPGGALLVDVGGLSSLSPRLCVTARNIFMCIVGTVVLGRICGSGSWANVLLFSQRSVGTVPRPC